MVAEDARTAITYALSQGNA
jgi:transposase